MQKYLYNLATDRYRGFIPAIIKIFLFILSCIYSLLVRILIYLYRLRPCRLNCKVISVGNITLGGTGKTSLVEYVARYLKAQGHKVAILSRGYKKKAKINSLTPNTYDLTPKIMGDEPYMLSKNLADTPVIVDADRIRGAGQAAKDYRVDTVILDDGFQQWKIKKDLEIVAVDAIDPFGNRHLLPRGTLREPLTSLRRADILVLTKTNLNPDTQEIKNFLAQINPQAAIYECIHKPMGFYQIDKPEALLGLNVLQGQSVTLFSGIGDPDSFENLIAGLGANIGLSFRFPDHYNYSEKDLNKIAEASKEKGMDTLITTEKDAARFCVIGHRLCAIRIMVLRIEVEIKNDQEFCHRLLQLYSG